MFVRQRACKFEVRDGQSAESVVTRREGALDDWRKRSPPHNWLLGKEPDAAHTAEGGITGPERVRFANRDELADSGGTVPQGVGDQTKVG